MTREGLCQPRRPIAASGVQPPGPALYLTRRRAGFRRSRARLRISRSTHSANQPAARDFQAASDGTPVEHQDRDPAGALGSAMTINAMLIAKSTRVMMSSTTPSWAPIRHRRITDGCGMRWNSRPLSYTSWESRRVAISPSSRPSSSSGTRSGYESISRSG